LQGPPAFHLLYYDAFAPAAQPELWTAEQFNRLLQVLLPGGIMVTYCSKSYVRKNMLAAGFVVEKIGGPWGKREMLRAMKPLQ
jgi:tRNA U34 5-methylaminomethyl-2-thiouridine-forming methyltransferase MnmC